MVTPAGYVIRFPTEGGSAGQHGSVAFEEKHWNAFQKEAGRKGMVQVEAAMTAWCRVGPENLPPSRFKFQKHHEKGGKSARIDAFKGHQVRFYGTTVQIDGKPTFLVTGCDISKKQDAADPVVLKSAGNAAIALINASKTGSRR